MLDKIKEALLNRNSEWGSVSPGALFRAVELGGEAGEALNEVKKLERTKLGMVGGKTDIQPLADELGDVIISAILLAIEYDLDLEKCAIDKFNKTSQKHGFKTRIEV